MRTLICRRFGPVTDLAIADQPTPTPREQEVLIRVQAAGLNYPDALIVQGKYQVKPALPFVPGAELAGVVAGIGSGVRRFRVGDSVMATAPCGAFAEACVVPVERVLPRPASLAPEVAAASLITYGTTLHALKDRAALAAGEVVLVLGASGGVGTAAIEVAKRMGARVIAAASNDAKLDVCRRLGADATINYTTENLRDRARQLSGGEGVDVIYDPVGGPYSEPALRSGRWGARHLVIGFAAGEIPRLPLNLALLGSRSILGVYWGDWAQRHPEKSAANFDQITDWLASGQLRPVVSARLRLEDAARDG
jgi:NADPH2:quinone reductase